MRSATASSRGLADVAIEFPVQRGRAKEIGEALPVEPLNGRVPAYDRGAEQPAGIIDQSPTLVGRVHVVLKWRMSPAGVPGREPLVQIGGLGVHLRLSRPADNDVTEQRHPTCWTEHVVRSPPANRGVDPVPRRRRDEDIEAPTTVVPLLERRRL